MPELPNNNPAMVNLKTGVLRLSLEYWKWLPHTWKLYIMYHELGHLNAGKSEEAAERWAIKHFIAHGYSPSELIKAHSEVYPWKGLTEQLQQGLMNKTKRAVELAKHYDYHHNGHKNDLKPLK